MGLATQEQQFEGEKLGAELRDIVDRYLARYEPQGVTPQAIAMNRAAAAVQCLAVDAVDNGGRTPFVEGCGFALGLMHEMFAEHGVQSVRQAMLQGFEAGRRAMREASRSRGAA